MKLAVSNIAWTNEEEVAAAELLQKLGVRYIEVALTKRWDDPTQASEEEIAGYKSFWNNYGIEIVALQSMLFNRLDLQLFESDENRQATLEYLQEFIAVAGNFGASAMVFGSPKNRQRGAMPYERAREVAIPFFDSLGTAALASKTVFCIEPNAPQYACDFVTNAQEGVELVKAVHNAGFGLHLDIACMTLAGDKVADSIKAAQAYLSHFHISSPMLEQVEDRDDVQHAEASAALREIGYDKFVSIEMKPGEQGENLARVERAVRFVQQVYTG